MKGRLTLEQLNSGISDINLILSKKYDLLYRSRKGLSLKDERLRGVYLEQGKDLKGNLTRFQSRRLYDHNVVIKPDLILRFVLNG